MTSFLGIYATVVESFLLLVAKLPHKKETLTYLIEWKLEGSVANLCLCCSHVRSVHVMYLDSFCHPYHRLFSWLRSS